MHAATHAEKAIRTIIQSGDPVRAAGVGLAMEDLLALVRSLEQRIVLLEAAGASPYSL